MIRRADLGLTRRGFFPGIPFLTMVFVVFVLSGCAREEEPLLDVPYLSWEHTTEATLDFPVPGHGAGLRKIYASPAAFAQALDADGNINYPEDSVFLKEVYPSPAPAADETPAMLLGMVKAPDDLRARGGWIWIVRDPMSGEETIFEDEFCVTCHTNANETHPYGSRNAENAFRDYVFHTPAIERSE